MLSAGGEVKQDDSVEQKKDEPPSIPGDSNNLNQLPSPVPSVSRAYSPIIEDPRERDSRPSSAELVEGKLIKLDDDLSISSRAISPTSVPDNFKEMPASVSSPTVSSTVSPTTGKLSQTDAKDEFNSGQSSQPIFKPLATEKGKSKTSGKTVGGWI